MTARILLGAAALAALVSCGNRGPLMPFGTIERSPAEDRVVTYPPLTIPATTALPPPG